MAVPTLSPDRVRRARREAMSLDAFIDLDGTFRDAYVANRAMIRFTGAEAAALPELVAPIDVLALVDGGCSDVIATLPIMAEIAAQSPGLRLSILLRTAANGDLTARYARSDGSRIPTYVFVADTGDELGTVVERAADMDAHLARFLADVRAADGLPKAGGAHEPFMQRVLRHRASLRDVERAGLVAEVLRVTGPGSRRDVPPHGAPPTPREPVTKRRTSWS